MLIGELSDGYLEWVNRCSSKTDILFQIMPTMIIIISTDSKTKIIIYNMTSVAKTTQNPNKSSTKPDKSK